MWNNISSSLTQFYTHVFWLILSRSRYTRSIKKPGGLAESQGADGGHGDALNVNGDRGI